MRKLVLSFILIALASVSYAQVLMTRKLKESDRVICYEKHEDCTSLIPPPDEYLKWKAGVAGRVKTANIEVDYNGFSEEAQAAFQAAVDVWETFITSPVTINVRATWAPLGAGVLGQAGTTQIFANFEGAQKLNVWYPIALAEKITGKDLNAPGEPDISATFSSSTNWNYVMGQVAGTKYDLVTVVMHEIGHGLGFFGSFRDASGSGSVGLSGLPVVYDAAVENSDQKNLIQHFGLNSAQLSTQLKSNSLFTRMNKPVPNDVAAIYAPATFSQGSSISHLDEASYPAGTANALMSPQVGMGEQNYNPGPLAMEIFSDMGWRALVITHQQLPHTENVNGPYTIKAKIRTDNVLTYQAGEVKLQFTTNGTSFTTLAMSPTGVADEFSAQIPGNGFPQTYGYFITVKDNEQRTFSNPGKEIILGNAPEQRLFFLTTGPDTDKPIVAHSPKPFLLTSDTQLEIDAKISDNLGIASTTLEYLINNVAQSNLPLVLAAPGADSIYKATINLGAGLANGDKVKYRIIATDNSNAGNQTITDYYTLNVVGLAVTQNSYSNNFNSASDDFFGNGYTITTPTGFSNPAIHTSHPYSQGTGFPDDRINFIYQLRIPIRVKETEATIKFDEIVLVEPGDAGTVFGDENFFDYVVVEGSKDGGVTWVPVANGYDSRDYSPWLTRYNSAITGNNSTAIGDPTLFRTRTLDLQQKFNTNDEVVIRFRLFSDPFAAGWGWCIDNLKIQIDDKAPNVMNNHVDYLKVGATELPIVTNATDASGLESLKVEFKINNGAPTEFEFDLNVPASSYTLNIKLAGDAPFSLGDVIEYRILASDAANNTGTLPATGFIKVPVINFSTPVTTYANNFNTATDDFVGNFFDINQPAGFNNGAIQSNHFYLNGFGLDSTSHFAYTLKKPIKISAQNPYMRFDEIAIVEGHPGGVVFGDDGFKDYVIVEGSKDGGATWHEILDGYDVNEQPAWVATFTAQGSGSPSLYRPRTIDLTESGDFVANDNVILRFRLFADESVNGWGWAVDNLYIQDAITGTEKELDASVHVYPNPTKGNITIEAIGVSSSNFAIQLLDTQGRTTYRATEEISDGKMSHTITGGNIPAGVYFVKVSDGVQTVIKKLIKID